MKIDDVLDNLLLNSKSIAFVAGAYQGATVKWLHVRYNCQIFGFEPQEEMCKVIRAMRLPKVWLYEKALGVEDARVPMVNTGSDAATLMVGDKFAERYVDMWSIGRVMDVYNLNHVDLFHMNMEGYETILLPHMIETGLIHRFGILVVQFHADADELIQSVVDAGFNIICDERIAWVAFQRNDIS